jgi:hypothetical protein
MVAVPAGEFLMGSNDYDREKPPHEVSIKAPFAVTLAEWDAAGLAYKPGDHGWGRGRRPAGDLVPVGSAFYVGHDAASDGISSPRVYAVTARHVLDALAHEVYLRLNMQTGQSTPLGFYESALKSWFAHPSDTSIDVAILKAGIPAVVDHLAIPKRFFLRQVGQGVRGWSRRRGVHYRLFRHHFGRSRNIPIVRVENLAAFDEEPVTTKAFGEMRAYLIESRSIGGLSGSPVFLNLGQVSVLNNQVKFMHGQLHYLMGLVHGHYDTLASEVASAETAQLDLANAKINAGIAIVVPVSDIRAVIDEYEQTDPVQPASIGSAGAQHLGQPA